MYRKFFVTIFDVEGDNLIDDRLKNGANELPGEHIHFGTDKFPNWKTVCEYLL